jgi:hypothetical protein
MRRFSLGIVGLAAVMLALSPVTVAAATTAQGISGWEFFPGIRSAATVYGASFGGWTDDVNTAAPVQWVPPPGSGGNWILSINYTGVPGPASSTAVTGGRWSLRSPGGPRKSGYVVSGAVMWPASDEDVGCGTANATVVLVLVTTAGHPGSVNGCLDDQHLASVFPPRVWGTVTLS